MVSPSEEQKLQQRVNGALQAQDAGMSDQVRLDIQRARIAALNNVGSQSLWFKLKNVVNDHQLPLIATPMALAVAIAVLVNFQPTQGIPELPAEMLLAADLPNEDLQLLEDLEFVDWLAKQQEEALL